MDEWKSLPVDERMTGIWDELLPRPLALQAMVWPTLFDGEDIIVVRGCVKQTKWEKCISQIGERVFANVYRKWTSLIVETELA